MTFGVNPTGNAGSSPVRGLSGGGMSRSSGAGPAPKASEASRADAATISEVGRLASEVKAAPAVRTEKVAAIREQIQNGTYETPEKLQKALDKMLAEHNLLGGIA